MSNEKWNLELSEYIKQVEPEKKARTWETAIGSDETNFEIRGNLLRYR